MPFEENDVSVNANGGTEIAKRGLTSVLDPKLLEPTQIICSRIRELDETKIRIFWANDLPEDPESSKLKEARYRDKFHHLIFISHWQYERYRMVLGLPYKYNHSVLETAIAPAISQFTLKPTDTIRLVYTSTPQRGLALLLPVFDALSKKYSNIHLDVFSSFKIYGWEERDKQFEPLYEFCRNHPQITYHGFTPHAQLLHHLNSCHIFAYPCIWPETSCRAMLEAMSAKLLCVHPNYGALPDTSGGLNLMYQGDDDSQTHMQTFYGALEAAIVRTQNDYPMLDNHLTAIKNYVDMRFGMATISRQWSMLLNQLGTLYPTIESRAFPKVSEPMFTYKIG